MGKSVDIWCDGSALKAPEGKFYCGSGAVLIYKGKIKEISESVGFATVNIAELKAPIFALEALKERCEVTIFSDSQYTIDTQTKWYSGWEKRGFRTQSGEVVKNKDLIQQLKKLSLKHKVEWVKVKSHSGIEMNDLADKLATEASSRFKEEILNANG